MLRPLIFSFNTFSVTLHLARSIQETSFMAKQSVTNYFNVTTFNKSLSDNVLPQCNKVNIQDMWAGQSHKFSCGTSHTHRRTKQTNSLPLQHYFYACVQKYSKWTFFQNLVGRQLFWLPEKRLISILWLLFKLPWDWRLVRVENAYLFRRWYTDWAASWTI